MPTSVLWQCLVLGLLALGWQHGVPQRERYPASWDIRVRQGTRLDSLKKELEPRVTSLPKHDADDRHPLPPWFRVFIRSRIPSLAESGPAQYPAAATSLLQWLSRNQNFSPSLLNSKIEHLLGPQEGAPRSHKQKQYPARWEVSIPAGTRLDSLRRSLEPEVEKLPDRDLEDTSPLPAWFRVYLRKKFPNLATDGPYQYPRTANRILQQMIAHPDSIETLR